MRRRRNPLHRCELPGERFSKGNACVIASTTLVLRHHWGGRVDGLAPDISGRLASPGSYRGRGGAHRRHVGESQNAFEVRVCVCVNLRSRQSSHARERSDRCAQGECRHTKSRESGAARNGRRGSLPAVQLSVRSLRRLHGNRLSADGRAGKNIRIGGPFKPEAQYACRASAR